MLALGLEFTQLFVNWLQFIKLGLFNQSLISHQLTASKLLPSRS